MGVVPPSHWSHDETWLRWHGTTADVVPICDQSCGGTHSIWYEISFISMHGVRSISAWAEMGRLTSLVVAIDAFLLPSRANLEVGSPITKSKETKRVRIRSGDPIETPPMPKSMMDFWKILILTRLEFFSYLLINSSLSFYSFHPWNPGIHEITFTSWWLKEKHGLGWWGISSPISASTLSPLPAIFSLPLNRSSLIKWASLADGFSLIRGAGSKPYLTQTLPTHFQTRP